MRIKILIKKIKPLYLFLKSILYVKRYGIKETINKIHLYLKKIKSDKLSYYISLKKQEKKKQINEIFSKNIKISIVTPIYNTEINFLKEMINSVINQTYSNWELCLADGSDNEHKYIENVCKKYIKKNKRIVYKKLTKNEGISENSNRAIELATGEFIGLLDHDDILHPSALYEVMKMICEKNSDFIYTDEAIFNNKTRNITFMHLKPSFAIDTLRANNYICHFSVFSREIIEKAGVFNKEFDGSQDHDLILRYTEAASCIVHISKLLYFWRSHESSVASDISTKLYAIEAGKNAVKKHLERNGISASVESTPVCETIYRMKYNLINKPLVSIIILNKDNKEILKCCLKSIIDKTTYKNYEIIIVENSNIENSMNEYYEEYKKYNNIKVIYWEDAECNQSELYNFGYKYSNGEHLIFLNNDIEIITENWIEEMLMYSQRNDVGAVGIKLFYPDNTIYHAGIALGIGGIASYYYHGVPGDTVGYMGKLNYAQNMSAVTAACMMVRRDVFEKVECFDTEYLSPLNDLDLCLKIRKLDYLIVWTPFAQAYKHVSKMLDNLGDVIEKQINNEKVEIFKNKWKEELFSGDIYYNTSNFSTDKADYSLK